MSYESLTISLVLAVGLLFLFNLLFTVYMACYKMSTFNENSKFTPENDEISEQKAAFYENRPEKS